MRLAGGIAGLAALSMGSAAVAQTAAEAFECSLPYVAAMEAASKLTILTEKNSDGIPSLSGPSSTITLAPGETMVFGYAPASLTLIVAEPPKEVKERSLAVTFETRLAFSEAADTALKQRFLCGDDESLCQGQSALTSDRGTMSYFRKRGSELLLTCRYHMDEENFAE